MKLKSHNPFRRSEDYSQGSKRLFPHNYAILFGFEENFSLLFRRAPAPTSFSSTSFRGIGRHLNLKISSSSMIQNRRLRYGKSVETREVLTSFCTSCSSSTVRWIDLRPDIFLRSEIPESLFCFRPFVWTADVDEVLAFFRFLRITDGHKRTCSTLTHAQHNDARVTVCFPVHVTEMKECFGLTRSLWKSFCWWQLGAVFVVVVVVVVVVTRRMRTKFMKRFVFSNRFEH